MTQEKQVYLVLRKKSEKNVTNSRYYEQIIQELKERSNARGEEYNFDGSQIQENFKWSVGECTKAALIIKTASGINRFQENKQYGSEVFEVISIRQKYG